MKSVGKKSKFFILMIFLGAIGGTLLGDILGSKIKMLDFLKISYSIGMPKILSLNLKVLDFTFGINFNVNFMTIIGIVLVIIIYRKF